MLNASKTAGGLALILKAGGILKLSPTKGKKGELDSGAIKDESDFDPEI